MHVRMKLSVQNNQYHILYLLELDDTYHSSNLSYHTKMVGRCCYHNFSGRGLLSAPDYPVWPRIHFILLPTLFINVLLKIYSATKVVKIMNLQWDKA